MISGTVRNLEAIIELEVLGADQRSHLIEATIDTGFNGYLTLPEDVVVRLKLSFTGHRRATLADGRVAVLDTYLASVTWHGSRKEVLISQAPGTSLIGMALLEGSRVSIVVLDRGDVAIEEVESP